MIEVAPELIAFLKEEYDRCRDDTIEDERTTAIERYNGEAYGDEEEGRSQVVARDTAETVDYMVISILRTIVSGDRVVEFTHRNADAAHQATETIMHLLMDEQDGYQILHDFLKAGLLEKTAVIMTYGEPQPPKRKVLEGVSAMALMAFEQQGVKVIEAEETGEDPEQGPIFTATVVEERPIKFCDSAVPNEEFYCSPDARTITEAALKGRRVRKTISDLVEMGYDKDELESAAEHGEDDGLSTARDEDRFANIGTRRGSARTLWWHEDYVRFDANGDGIAELLYIQRTSDFKVFAVDEMEDPDDHPFEDWCPFPMQHRRVGQSLADKVMDLERIRTVLLRQSLDGIYTANNPSTYLHKDSIDDDTIEDLLTVRPGRIIRYKGAIAPVERSGNFDPGAGFTMLEFMNGERESRTGITRLNQGLDADTLNKTATGTALMQAQGQQVEEYLARNFANALARLFTKKAKLLRRHGKPITVPIDGEYVEVDPSQWPEDMIARPRVGLGSGRKEQRIAFRRELIGMQAQALQAGLRIVNDEKFYSSAKGFVTDAGLGDVSEFFEDPSKLPPVEPQPDPKMAEAQAKIEIEQAKLQAKMQADQAAHQADMVKSQAKHQLEQGTALARLQLEQARAEAEMQLQRERAEFEARLAAQKAQFEQALEQERVRIDAQLQAARARSDHEVKMSKNREGGDLSK